MEIDFMVISERTEWDLMAGFFNLRHQYNSTVPDRYPVDLSGSRRFDQLNVFPGVQGNEKNWSPRFQMYNHVWRPRPFYAPDRISIKLCISASESLRDSILGSKLPQ